MSFADLPISTFSLDTCALPRLGHRQLRGHLGSILGEVRAVGGAVESVKDGAREVVPDHDVFDDLVHPKPDADARRDSVPPRLAAAAAGVVIPSTTLDKLGLDSPVDVEAPRVSCRGYPVRHTHDEHGTPLLLVKPVAVGTVSEVTTRTRPCSSSSTTDATTSLSFLGTYPLNVDFWVPRQSVHAPPGYGDVFATPQLDQCRDGKARLWRAVMAVHPSGDLTGKGAPNGV